MSIYITQIEKHRFVCGLFWQSLSRPRELKKEAADLAARLDFDLQVLRTDNATAQVGFAQSKDGARRGMLSLAAAVNKTVAIEGAYYDGRKQRVHNWLGAFKLPDGMWTYFAVRDANFLPNGDFAGTREEVLERLHGDYGLGGWNVVIGDPELADLGFHNFNAKRIEDMLPHGRGGAVQAHKWWALRAVRTSIPVRTVAVTVCVVALAVIAGGWYWQHQKKLEEEARERALEEMRRKLQMQAAPAALPHPWIDKPEPKTMVQACMDQFEHMTAGGWRLDKYACNATSATYDWSRHDSTVAYLLEQVPDASVALTGDTASHTERLDLGAGGDDALMDQRSLIEPVQSQLQLLGLKLKLVRQEPPAPPPAPVLPGAPAQPKPPVPDWKTFMFSLDAGGVPPVEVAEIIGLPGVRIEQIVHRAGNWSIEGVMYAK